MFYAEKAFDKIQYLFMINKKKSKNKNKTKQQQQNRNEENFFNLRKGICEKPTASLILYCED